MPKQLRKIILAIFAALFITLPFISAFAHSGRTDSKGGHNNHSSNSYHYHHGYSAHQHNDGYCPIEPDNERYYSEFYKFKLFLAKVPKEFIYITPIVINALLVPLFLLIIKKRRKTLFPELPFEERDKIQTNQIQYFGDFNTTEFFDNIVCVIVPFVLFAISSIIIDNTNRVGIIFFCLLFTAYYTHKICKEYKTSHNTIRTVHHSKKTIKHIFDDITNDDYIEVNPSDCYLPQHFQVKLIVFTFYIINLALFLASLAIRFWG